MTISTLGRKAVSIAWLAVKIILVLLLMNSGRTVFVYQNF